MVGIALLFGLKHRYESGAIALLVVVFFSVIGWMVWPASNATSASPPSLPPKRPESVTVVGMSVLETFKETLPGQIRWGGDDSIFTFKGDAQKSRCESLGAVVSDVRTRTFTIAVYIPQSPFTYDICVNLAGKGRRANLIMMNHIHAINNPEERDQ